MLCLGAKGFYIHDINIDIQKVIDAAEAAGETILGYFDKAAKVIEKVNAKSVVTEADKAAEQLILKMLDEPICQTLISMPRKAAR